jgi:benzoylformate decarboxylase
MSELAGAIDASAHPALVTVRRSGGSGWVQAVALAEKLDAPVWAAPSSERAPFPETHPLNLGGLPFAGGEAGRPRPRGGDRRPGVPLLPVRRWPVSPDGAKQWQVTDDPEEAARAPVGESLLGDACAGDRQLTTRRNAPCRRWRMAPHPPRPTAPTKRQGCFEKHFVKSPAGVLVEGRRPTCPTFAMIEYPDNFVRQRRASTGQRGHRAG